MCILSRYGKVAKNLVYATQTIHFAVFRYVKRVSLIFCVEKKAALMSCLFMPIHYAIPTIKSISFWNTSFTRLAVSITSSWLSFTGNTPAAMLVMQEMPQTFIPI